MSDRFHIVMLAVPCRETNVIYHALSGKYRVTLILEEPVSKAAMVRRRIRTLGLFRVIGQILFKLLVVPMLGGGARKRQILEQKGLTDTPPSDAQHVVSVNGPTTLPLLKALDPDVVLVNGTRIISTSVLEGTRVPFINIHTGITPTYRGVHGGYWALVEGEPARCGVTVHYIDKGIDTGQIIAQARVDVSQQDNFNTYPLLQIAMGIELLEPVLHNMSQGGVVETVTGSGPSVLRSHPGIAQYLWYRIFRGVK